MPPAKMLGFYAKQFPTTEVNYTFRRLPSDQALANWVDQTPKRFRFALKAPERITHRQRLKACEPLLPGFVGAALKLGPKRGPLLFQLPPQLRRDLPLLENFLALLPQSLVAAFEFRHASWFDDSVFDALRQRNATLCIAHTDELETPMVFTSATGYFRLRRVDYTAGELRRWADSIRDQASRLMDIYVYFKHEEAGTGPRLAEKLSKLLRLE